MSDFTFRFMLPNCCNASVCRSFLRNRKGKERRMFPSTGIFGSFAVCVCFFVGPHLYLSISFDLIRKRKKTQCVHSSFCPGKNICFFSSSNIYKAFCRLSVTCEILVICESILSAFYASLSPPLPIPVSL